MELKEVEGMRVVSIPISEIYCDNDFNCRGPIIPRDVLELAKSIEESGLQSPIIVQPWDKLENKKWRIVAGHRRYTAFKVNATAEIPSIIKYGLTDLQARQLNLEENLKRKELNLLQEANALKPFLDAGWTESEVCKRFNQSRGWVQARVNLLRLPESIQNEAAAGFLTQEHIRQLGTISDPAKQAEAVKKIKQSKMLGEKKKISVAGKKTSPHSKKRREREEIFEKMEMFMEVIGSGFYSRCMGWAAGEVSDIELLIDFKKYVKAEFGKDWQIPQVIMNAAIGNK